MTLSTFDPLAGLARRFTPSLTRTVCVGTGLSLETGICGAGTASSGEIAGGVSLSARSSFR
jgi:hypothetical protein